MIKNFSTAWGENQEILRNYLKKNRQEEYDSYSVLFKKTIELVVNPYLKQIGETVFDIDTIQECTTNDYQGTLALIMSQCNAYYKSDFVATYVDYGSCSGCDTLLSISQYGEEIPNEEQVREYLQLCLNMLQRCKYIWVEGGEEC